MYAVPTSSGPQMQDNIFAALSNEVKAIAMVMESADTRYLKLFIFPEPPMITPDVIFQRDPFLPGATYILDLNSRPPLPRSLCSNEV